MIYCFEVGKGDFALSCPKRYAFMRSSQSGDYCFAVRSRAANREKRDSFLLLFI